MTSTTEHPVFVVVSPVKDEERYVGRTLESMISQTVRPARWIVVDDGSADDTPAIVMGYAADHPFIELVHHPHAGERAAGAPVMAAFDFGRSLLAGTRYDYIVKLDCDVSFPADYFAGLLETFAADRRLGIASGIYLEQDADGEWTPIAMPGYHAFGASKMVRRTCFEEIGGFCPSAGWDTVDEIKARARGWTTGHVPDLAVKHHKREGSGVGQMRTSRMHGEIFYTTGGDPLFFVLKVLHRLRARPLVRSAAALAYGYLSAALTRKPRLVTRTERDLYRQLLRRRMFGHPSEPLPAVSMAGRR